MSRLDTNREEYYNKRRRLDGLADDEIPLDLDAYDRPQKRLTHDAYTIGWVCALPLELAAARSMLDEEHEKLDLPSRDHNTYCLGAIGDHNVVLCCLPVGEYGLISASKVASNMLQAFPNSRFITLLVGIGGGVPSMNHDIRLGDVAVSISRSGHPAVKQYDYGKTIANGFSVSQGSLNKPAPILLMAVSGLIAEHKLGRDRFPRYMAEAVRKHSLSGYDYPGTEFDTDPEYHCTSDIEGSKCVGCGLTKIASRLARASTRPVVHYGAIGSGNQVIKDSCTRDKLAKEHDIICYEMEAAGIVDETHCLVIRGICDYCDDQKKKVFQDYSALAAAAYAKELLLSIPPRRNQLKVSLTTTASGEGLGNRKTILEALDFEESESRKATVKPAHSQTCQWFLNQQEYLDWLDVQKLPQHNGLLWIRGKAGCGKSTIMKFLVDNLESQERQAPSETIVISFFFNARGSELERSTIGMYRALLYQLLTKTPDVQYLLNLDSYVNKLDNIMILQHLLEAILKELRDVSIFCFIDALDECPEDQIQDMVTCFERLADNATHNKSCWYVCFSSRYYPNVSTDLCISLALDQHNEHANDIEKYINTELKAGTGDAAQILKAEIADKSGGVFLWVFLVVRILKKLFNRGRGNRIEEMRSKLNEIPLELDELFSDILTKDNNNIADLVLTIQWLLYSKRPLKREEFYYAVQSGDNNAEMDHWNVEEASTSDMDYYILDCSKGLVELTRSNQPSIQFIHESVREYLLKPGALENLSPEPGVISHGRSHRFLFKCCWRYMAFCDADKPHIPNRGASLQRFREEKLSSFPFLEYATQNLLYHADNAARAQLLETSFYYNLDIDRYTDLYNTLIGIPSIRSSHGGAKFLVFLVKRQWESLLISWIRIHPPDISDLKVFVVELARMRYRSLYEKVSSDCASHLALNREDVRELGLALLDLLGECLKSGYAKSGIELITRLLIAPLLTIEETSKQVILDRAPRSVTPFKDKNTAGLAVLRLVIEKGNLPVLQTLLKYSADVDSCGPEVFKLLRMTIEKGNVPALQLLLEYGANIKCVDGTSFNSLCIAVNNKRSDMAELLLESSDDAIQMDVSNQKALDLAISRGQTEMVGFLLEHGANVN